MQTLGPGGAFLPQMWRRVCVGQVLLVQEDEALPADLRGPPLPKVWWVHAAGVAARMLPWPRMAWQAGLGCRCKAAAKPRW